MGAGLSKERQCRIVYRELQKIRRELSAQGVESRYKKSALWGEKDANTFWIGYQRSNASNGECFLWPVAQIQLNGVFADYSKPEWIGPSYEKTAKPIIVENFRK